MGAIINPRLCVRCKGKNLCGRPCYFLEVLKLKAKHLNLKKHEMLASPPSIFVGRFGYPHVFIGSLGVKGENQARCLLHDSPKEWFSKGLSVREVLERRLEMINSTVKSCVRMNSASNAIVERIRETAMASNPVDSEIVFRKKPALEISFSHVFSPLGLRAPVEKIRVVDNLKVDRRVEKIVYDTDLRATEGVGELYRRGVDENYITRVFSAGLLGTKRERKLVPTRWSITAVDDIIGRNLLNEIKTFEKIDTSTLFYSEYNGNRFWVLLLPRTWCYELIEITHAFTSNPAPQRMLQPTPSRRTEIYITRDAEDYYGRKSYVEETAGGYYAARLGVAEYLHRIKKQAGVLVVREILPDYWAPLGVWLVRETVRDAMRKAPKYFDSAEEAVRCIELEMKAKVQLHRVSRILRTKHYQTRLSSLSM